MRHDFGTTRQDKSHRQDPARPWAVFRARLASAARIRATKTPPPAPRERLRDASHPVGAGLALWAPVLLILIPVAATLVGLARLAARMISGAVGGLAAVVLGAVAALRGLRAGMSRLVAPIFTFTPAANPRGQAGDYRPMPEPAKPEPEPIAPPTPNAEALVRRMMAETPDKGDAALPDDINLLARLLSDPPPSSDFAAADMVRDCFDQFGSAGLQSRALLAVAQHLSRHFARPSHLPLATTRAWRMLDPVLFEDEMADQLSILGRFIMDWQRSQQTFLCLDHGEIELIELLFENMNPAHHAKEMTDVLNFKVLSNRRQGLLRRMPHRLRKASQEPARRGEIVALVDAYRAFLSDIANARHYQPIIDAAAAALEEVGKLAEKLAPPPAAAALPPGAQGQPLARITPVKMAASELADRAMSPAAAAAPPPAAQPVPAAPPQLQAQIRPPQPAAAIAQAAPSTAPAPPAPPALPATMGPPARRGLASGPRYSAELRPMAGSRAITASTPRQSPTALSAVATPLAPGKRPEIPAIALGPLPVLATASSLQRIEAKPRPPAPISGRISLPAPGAKPVVAKAPAIAPAPVAQAPVTPAPVAQTPVAQAPMASATGRIQAPPRPVTDLTLIPKTKRPPITQAVKRQSVLKVLRGEPSSAIAAALGIRVSKLDEWVDAFITAGAGALSPTPKPKRVAKKAPEAEPLSADLLRAKLAEVLATAQLIERAMDMQLPARRPVLLPPPVPSGAGKRPRKKG